MSPLEGYGRRDVAVRERWSPAADAKEISDQVVQGIATASAYHSV